MPEQPNPVDEFFRHVIESKVVVVTAVLLLVVGIVLWARPSSADKAFEDCLIEAAIDTDRSVSACHRLLD